MVETHLEGATSAESGCAGQEVQADDRFEDGGLTSRLAAKHGDAGQGDVLVKTDVAEFILADRLLRYERDKNPPSEQEVSLNNLKREFAIGSSSWGLGNAGHATGVLTTTLMNFLS